MKKWRLSNKKKPTKSQEQKESFFQKLNFRNREKEIYNPKKLKNDEKDKKNHLVRIKRAQLKGSGGKRILKAVFVIFVLFLFLGAFNGFKNNQRYQTLKAKMASVSASGDPQGQNLATRQGVGDFVTDFMEAYTDITPGDDGKKQREKAIKPYIANGVDPQLGIDYSSVENEQKYESSKVLEVDAVGKNMSDVTVQVAVKTLIPKEKTEKYKTKEKIKKGKDKGKEKEVQKERKVKYNEEKESTLTYVVPVFADQKGYAVIDIPQPVTPRNVASNKSVEDAYQGLTPDTSVENSVKSFLNNFFKAYVSEKDDENIRYFFRNADDVQTLKGGWQFVRIKDVQAYPEKEYENSSDGKQFIVQANVQLKQPNGITSDFTYEMTMRQNAADKFEISSIKNKTNSVNS
ncbi:conjugal transfer protein [Bacillus amyloliquefaciens]|uniref:conjugal transfer protein n=1 Tax=Bacillus amyloliquefaciens TaxID=1390 RepID=UPI0028069B17|nr:conjugal transfer protein [Bacillus amyloliquefaciens]MDQ8094893.1 conjugal transfer protein [Bacillus amyloliquefaciens]